MSATDELEVGRPPITPLTPSPDGIIQEGLMAQSVVSLLSDIGSLLTFVVSVLTIVYLCKELFGLGRSDG